MAFRRTPVRIFILGNPLYDNATVTFFAIDNSGSPTTTKIPLYTGPTGATQGANPQTLDSTGQLQFPLWFDLPFVAKIGNAAVPNHQTGVNDPEPGGWQGNWATATLYQIGDQVTGPDSSLYVCALAHTAGTFATDLAAGKWQLFANVAAITAGVTAAAGSAAAALVSENASAANAVSTGADAGAAHADRLLADADAAAALVSANAAAASAASISLPLAIDSGGTGSTTSSGARTALGLGTSATHAASDFLLAANNLSDVTAASARTNLGLGTAATAGASAAGTLAAVSGAITSGHIATFADTSGTIHDGGALPSSAVALVSTVIADGTSPNITFTGLTSGNNYLLLVNNLFSATSGDTTQLQVGTGGTPTWITSGYSYSGAQVTTASGVAGEASTSAAGVFLDFNFGISNAAPGVSGFYFINNLANGDFTLHGEEYLETSNNAATEIGLFINGSLRGNSTAKTALRINNSVGHNWTNGVVSLYKFG